MGDFRPEAFINTYRPRPLDTGGSDTLNFLARRDEFNRQQEERKAQLAQNARQFDAENTRANEYLGIRKDERAQAEKHRLETEREGLISEYEAAMHSGNPVLIEQARHALRRHGLNAEGSEGSAPSAEPASSAAEPAADASPPRPGATLPGADAPAAPAKIEAKAPQPVAKKVLPGAAAPWSQTKSASKPWLDNYMANGQQGPKAHAAVPHREAKPPPEHHHRPTKSASKPWLDNYMAKQGPAPATEQDGERMPGIPEIDSEIVDEMLKQTPVHQTLGSLPVRQDLPATPRDSTDERRMPGIPEIDSAIVDEMLKRTPVRQSLDAHPQPGFAPGASAGGAGGATVPINPRFDARFSAGAPADFERRIGALEISGPQRGAPDDFERRIGALEISEPQRMPPGAAPGQPLPPPQPLPGMRALPSSGGYRITDAQGNVLSEMGPGAHGRSPLSAREMLAPLLVNAPDADRKAIAKAAIEVAERAAQDMPLEKAVALGKDFYQSQLVEWGKSQRVNTARGMHNGGAPAGGFSKGELGRLGGMGDNVRWYMDKVGTQYGIKKIRDSEAEILDSLQQLSTEKGLADRVAVKMLVHKMNGANASDKEYASIINGNGMWSSLVTRINELDDGRLAPAYERELRAVLMTTAKELQRRKREAGEAGRQAVLGDDNLALSRDEKEAAADNVYGFLSGDYSASQARRAAREAAAAPRGHAAPSAPPEHQLKVGEPGPQNARRAAPPAAAPGPPKPARTNKTIQMIDKIMAEPD